MDRHAIDRCSYQTHMNYISLIYFLILAAYPAVSFIHYRYGYQSLSQLCGGRWTKLGFLFIPIGYITIAVVQYRAGCEHLIGECYKDALPKGDWWLIKELFLLFIPVWMLVFLFRLGRLGVRWMRGR